MTSPTASTPGPQPGLPPAAVTARALVEGLAAAGVREVVLCPGSRSAPLAYALHAADAAGVLRLHVRIDERSAGFTALGMGRVTGHPAVVVTTSGTAVANLVPAVLEAHHAGVGMLVLSADRPVRLRGTWANQTSDRQAGLLGGAVTWARDVAASADAAQWSALATEAVAAATGWPPGPVHLNIGFDDPLVPPDLSWQPGVGPARIPPPPTPAPVADPTAVLRLGPRTVVVAGDSAGPQARALAESAGWPLLAEPTSQARSGESLIPAYRLLLGGPLGAAVQRVVVFGRPTLSRPVTRLLARADVELVVAGRAAALGGGPGRPALLLPEGVRVSGRDDPAWLVSWQRAGRRAADAVAQVLAAEREVSGGLSGYDVARQVVAASGPNTGLVVSASNPIRDADLAAGSVRAAFALANRGLSGIDGTLSTAAGASLVAGPTRVLLGDLAFLHDSNALLLGPGEPVPSVQAVVVNDGGGGIFGLLEHGEPRFAAAYERVFATPHRVDLAAVCRAHGVAHRLVVTGADLDAELRQAPGPGIGVVEVVVQRDRERGLAQRLRDAVESVAAG